MKSMIIADPHSGKGTRLEESESEDSTIAEFFFDKTFGFLDYAIEMNPDVKRLFIIGDTFEKRQYTDNLILNKTISWFDKHTDKEIVILYGNHDTYFRSTNRVNTVDILGRIFPNITIVPEETLLLDNILFVNWITKENSSVILKAIENTNAEYLMGHFDIVGATMHQFGTTSKKGLDPNVFEKFKHVFSGHYHMQSTIKNITYVGNPIQTSFADCGLPKGVMIFDSENDTWVRFDNPESIYHKIDGNAANIDDFDPTGKIIALTYELAVNEDMTALNAIVDKLKPSTMELHVRVKPPKPDVLIDGIDVGNAIEINSDSVISQVVSTMTDFPEASDYLQQLHKEAMQNVVVGEE